MSRVKKLCTNCITGPSQCRTSRRRTANSASRAVSFVTATHCTHTSAPADAWGTTGDPWSLNLARTESGSLGPFTSSLSLSLLFRSRLYEPLHLIPACPRPPLFADSPALLFLRFACAARFSLFFLFCTTVFEITGCPTIGWVHAKKGARASERVRCVRANFGGQKVRVEFGERIYIRGKIFALRSGNYYCYCEIDDYGKLFLYYWADFSNAALCVLTYTLNNI